MYYRSKIQVGETFYNIRVKYRRKTLSNIRVNCRCVNFIYYRSKIQVGETLYHIGVKYRGGGNLMQYTVKYMRETNPSKRHRQQTNEKKRLYFVYPTNSPHGSRPIFRNTQIFSQSRNSQHSMLPEFSIISTTTARHLSLP